jgi:competence ComEA-like helix-hairpin-helix protein
MNLNTEPIRNWFGFSRRERRSAFTLLLIVILIIIIRYTVPERRIAIEDITGTFSDTAIQSLPKSAQMNSGFSGKRSLTMLNYRSRDKGVKIRQDNSNPKRSKTDINDSDSATLVKLPGIGPVLSARIIKYRHLLGGFARIEQLREVYGLSEETFDAIKDRITADSTAIIRISINSADYKELSHIHYLERYEVTAILKYRQIKGRFTGISDLTDNKLITTEKALKISPYLNFEY